MLYVDRDVLFKIFFFRENVVRVACELQSDAFLFFAGLCGVVNQLVSFESFLGAPNSRQNE